MRVGTPHNARGVPISFLAQTIRHFAASATRRSVAHVVADTGKGRHG